MGPATDGTTPCQPHTKRSQTNPGAYAGFADCLRRSVAADGVGVLWKGSLACAAKAALSSGAVFFVYEICVKMMPADEG